MITKKYLVILMFLTLAMMAQAQRVFADADDGLIIHAAEIGVGKFHRYDNTVHPYEHDNIWINYVLPADASMNTPRIVYNDDRSVTIFFSHLEELLKTVEKVSNEKKMKVSVLNINAHGMPGGMWFPANEKMMKSDECKSWVESANGDDKKNYEQYYSPVSKSEIENVRMISHLPSWLVSAPCVTMGSSWTSILKKNKSIKNAFAPDAQLHLFSCVVGLGSLGKNFTKEVAAAIFSGEGSKVVTSLDFGLGDWSIPEGMSFWDYLNGEQLDRDNARYPVDRKDRDIMQKGQVRVVMKSNGKWEHGVVSNLDFMLGTKDSLSVDARALFEIPETTVSDKEYQTIKAKGLELRIPGTNVTTQIILK